MKFNQFYKGKKVLVTGHTGFKGSWLSLWLIEMGAIVTGYSIESGEKNSIYNIFNLKNKLTHIQANINDFNSLLNAINKYNFDIIFHLAAQPIVKESYINPSNTILTNILGTMNLLEAIRINSKIKSAIIVTTDKVYENTNKNSGYIETDKLGGHDPYSASKAGAEIITQSYIKSYFLTKKSCNIASVRAGNVIGGGDWSKYRLIPDIIRSIETKVPLEVRYPFAVRPWQHVLEPLSGYLELGKRLYESEIDKQGSWNFGPYEKEVYKVNDVLNNFKNYFPSLKIIDVSNSVHSHETSLLLLNIDKSLKNLHWKPRFNFHKAIELTAEWYKNYQSKSIYEITLNQIKTYSSFI
jgi:CDP-glucose 4,6-dehydratase